MWKPRKYIAIGTLLGWLLITAQAACAQEPLALRINDAVALPGGIAAVTLRTYSSRPIGQGQVCLSFAFNRQMARTGVLAPKGGPQGPVLEVIDAIVFSAAGDTVSEIMFDPADPAQPLVVAFSSQSASINAIDGPLAVIYYRLRADLLPGERFDLQVDAANTILFDPDSAEIAISTRDGRVDIRAPGAPLDISGGGEDIVAGDIALMSMQTKEAFPIAFGQVALRYNRRVIPGPPKVVLDPRYGSAKYTVAHSPGFVMVWFSSPDMSFNTVPGDIVTVLAESAPLAPGSGQTSIDLDPNQTFLVGANGQQLSILVEGDVFLIQPSLPGRVRTK